MNATIQFAFTVTPNHEAGLLELRYAAGPEMALVIPAPESALNLLYLFSCGCREAARSTTMRPWQESALYVAAVLAVIVAASMIIAWWLTP
jgi:hypothetical protein